MKKYLLLVLAVLLLVPTVVFAQSSDENVTKRRPDRPTQPQIQEIREEQTAAREENKAKMEELRTNIAENHANRLTKRFDFYYKRFSDIIKRFEARLAILNVEKKDTTEATAKLALVKSKLEEAKKAGDAAILAFKAITPTKFAEQKTERLVAKDQVNKVVKLYQEVHTLLKDALKALKVISKPALPASSAAVENAK